MILTANFKKNFLNACTHGDLDFIKKAEKDNPYLYNRISQHSCMMYAIRNKRVNVIKHYSDKGIKHNNDYGLMSKMSSTVENLKFFLEYSHLFLDKPLEKNYLFETYKNAMFNKLKISELIELYKYMGIENYRDELINRFSNKTHLPEVLAMIREFKLNDLVND